MPARRRRAADPLLAEKGKSPFILLGGHRRVTKKILLPGRWSREKKKKASVEPVQTPSHSYYVYLIFPTRKFYHSTPSRCFWSALSQVDFLFAHLGSSFQRCQYVSDESRHVGDCTISSWLAVTSAVFLFYLTVPNSFNTLADYTHCYTFRVYIERLPQCHRSRFRSVIFRPWSRADAIHYL